MGHHIQKMKTKSQRIPLNLLYISYSKYDDKDWHSTPHSHHFTELFYIKKGNGHFLIEDQKIAVGQDDLIIINPNVQHTEISTKENSLEYVALAFDGFAFTFSADEKHQNFALIDVKGKTFYEPMFDQLLKEIHEQEVNFEMYCQNLLEIIIIKLIRDQNYSIEESEFKNINSSIFSTKNYIDTHFKEDINLDILADVSHMNKYYLAHSFKESFGVSPIEYLNNIRIQEAKLLLETTDYSIAEISDVIGFSSQSYFSQFFRTQLKQTPSVYRKNSKKKK